VQDTVLLRHRQAGIYFALFEGLSGLLNPPIDQQRCTDLTVAVAAALRALDALAPRRVKNALPPLDLQNQAGGL
jgi:hypothetical protein